MAVKLLNFQKEILSNLIEEDALVIFGKGLGLRTITAAFLSVHADPTNLVLLLDVDQNVDISYYRTYISQCLQILADNGDDVEKNRRTCFKHITSDCTADERERIYREGGILAITSRILIVDMLRGKIPIHMITGIVINKAHRVTETSPESFILRIYRKENKEGFIKAFSDFPQGFTTDFAKLQKTMKYLFVRKVHLWPRFHLSIANELNHNTIDVSEIRQGLSSSMDKIQTCILECLEACLSELRRAKTTIDPEDLTLEKALSGSFEFTLKVAVENGRNFLSPKTRQIISDARNLRRILHNLVTLDCISFNAYLESIMASYWVNAKGKRVNMPMWLLLDAADMMFVLAKERVYKVNENNTGTEEESIIPVLEDQPKWECIGKIIENIEKDRLTSEDSGLVLVVGNNKKTLTQIKDFIDQNMGGDKNTRLKKFLNEYQKWKSGLSKASLNLAEIKDGINAPQTPIIQAGSSLKGKRRRTRGGFGNGGNTIQSSNSNSLPQNMENEAKILRRWLGLDPSMEVTSPNVEKQDDLDDSLFDPNQFDFFFHVIPPSATILYHQYGGEGDDQMLEDVKPQYVIMTDPNPGFIRRLEVFKANNLNSGMKVYFLVYANSTEEQYYLSEIRKEKDAFERLIREKSLMAIPLEQDGRITQLPEDELFQRLANTRMGGGGILTTTKPQIIVDVREFRSSLPAALYARNIKVIPCTLKVGDYILSPTMCVERKSIPDLISSFTSGRLFSQIQSILQHYKYPILLIEFDENKPFSLQGSLGVSDDISIQDISSKLVLLNLCFPQVRIIWASSPKETGEIFEELKVNQEEPDPDKAIVVGDHNEENMVFQESKECLLSMPGVSYSNVHLITQSCNSLVDLCDKDEASLTALLGSEAGRKLFHFLHCNMVE